MLRSLSQAINNLGWDMLSQLCEKGIPPDGTAVSGVSIAIALVMLAGGAEEPKRKEFCQRLGSHINTLSIEFHAVQKLLTNTSGGLHVGAANALFADRMVEIFPSYIDFLRSFAAHVDATLPNLQDATTDINAWVSTQTKGLIPSLLSPDLLAQAHMVFINTLYFKAAWKTKFSRENTIQNFPFHKSKHEKSVVDMMFFHKQEHLVYDAQDYTAVCLPYSSGPDIHWSFIAYLPQHDKSIADILPGIRQEGIPRGFWRKKLDRLGLPKFNLRTQDSIAENLNELGYPLAGDFPLMGTGANVVSQVIHSVTIVLDEEGTEAAAATAVILERRLPARPPPELIFDRPFLFSIVSQELGLVLFTGVFCVS